MSEMQAVRRKVCSRSLRLLAAKNLGFRRDGQSRYKMSENLVEFRTALKLLGSLSEWFVEEEHDDVKKLVESATKMRDFLWDSPMSVQSTASLSVPTSISPCSVSQISVDRSSDKDSLSSRNEAHGSEMVVQNPDELEIHIPEEGRIRLEDRIREDERLKLSVNCICKLPPDFTPNTFTEPSARQTQLFPNMLVGLIADATAVVNRKIHSRMWKSV